MKPKHSPPKPPWERPSRVIWFVLAIIVAMWLTVHMPAGKARVLSNATSTTTAITTPSPKLPIAPESSNIQSGITNNLQTQTHTGKSTFSTTTPTQSREAPTITQSEPKLAPKSTQKSAKEKILAKLKSFTRLFTIVGIAAFLGGLMEARCWHMALAWIMGKLTRMARLPDIVGIAMPTALVSSSAANSILVGCHEEGQIPTRALLAGGMANSYLSYISHSIRVMYPVLGAIGLPGFIYFGLQFSGGLMVILSVLLWNRWYVARHNLEYTLQGTQTAAASIEPLPWPKAFKKAAVRSLTLLFRLTYITVPLMLGIEWMLKSGSFDFWDQYIPAQISRYFPAESVYIVATQIGGLIQSSAVSANLRAEGLIDNAQILLAMLVGSAVGNPIRTLRRNLPSALALFPVPIALTIVLSMQISRFIVTLLGIGGVVAFMQYVLYR